MGIYARADSPFWWMLLERPAVAPLKISTKVLRDAATAEERKEQRRAAEEIYRKRMTDLAKTREGLQEEPKPATTFDAYADWWETHKLPTRRGSVREAYAVKRLRAAFGPMDLAAVTRDATVEYCTARLATHKPGTVNREVDVLKAMLRDAVPTYLEHSPLVGMARLRTVKIKKRLLTHAEEARLLKQLAALDQAFMIVAIDTLIRLSNVINLKWTEVQKTKLELDDSKTGPYAVPLSTRARAALASVPRKKGEIYVFPHRRVAKTDRDRRGAIRTMLKRACARCRPKIPYGRAVRGITFHTGTRATGATRMLRANVDPRTVQAVGNWKDFRSMQEYLETTNRLTQSAVNKIAG